MYVFRVHDPFHRGQLAIAALFCSLGFQYATWASRIPALKAGLGLTAAEVGVLLMAAGIGVVASFPLVPVLVKRLRSARLALLSALCLTLLLGALAAAPDYPVALLVMVTGGVAAALIGFACVGLGCAAVTPCVYVAAAKQGSQALALVAATGTTGLLAGPPLIGFVANASSLVWGLAVVAAAAGVVCLCSTRILWSPVSS